MAPDTIVVIDGPCELGRIVDARDPRRGGWSYDLGDCRYIDRIGGSAQSISAGIPDFDVNLMLRGRRKKHPRIY